MSALYYSAFPFSRRYCDDEALFGHAYGGNCAGVLVVVDLELDVAQVAVYLRSSSDVPLDLAFRDFDLHFSELSSPVIRVFERLHDPVFFATSLTPASLGHRSHEIFVLCLLPVGLDARKIF